LKESFPSFQLADREVDSYRTSKDSRESDLLPKYIVYYMDNDGRRKIIARGLSYQKAVEFCQKNRAIYNAELNYEMQDRANDTLLPEAGSYMWMKNWNWKKPITREEYLKRRKSLKEWIRSIKELGDNIVGGPGLVEFEVNLERLEDQWKAHGTKDSDITINIHVSEPGFNEPKVEIKEEPIQEEIIEEPNPTSVTEGTVYKGYTIKQEDSGIFTIFSVGGARITETDSLEHAMEIINGIATDTADADIPSDVMQEFRKIGSLVDAEYDALKNMKKSEVKTYLIEHGFSRRAVDYFMKEAGVF